MSGDVELLDWLLAAAPVALLLTLTMIRRLPVRAAGMTLSGRGARGDRTFRACNGLDNRRGQWPFGGSGHRAAEATRPDHEVGQQPGTAHAFLPYLVLLAVAMPTFLHPASRSWVRTHLTLAPSFPGTRNGSGQVNPATTDYTSLAFLGPWDTREPTS